MKRPTYTSLVFDYLVALDDFAPLAQIAADSGAPRHGALSALLMLKNYRAVDCTDVHGELWWCALPESDTRMRRIRQIKEGITRRPKRKRSEP